MRMIGIGEMAHGTLAVDEAVGRGGEAMGVRPRGVAGYFTSCISTSFR